MNSSQNPDTTNLANRIGESLIENYWDGVVSEYHIVFGTDNREKDPEGVVYKKHAEILITGRYLKILPPPEYSELEYIIGMGEDQRLMRMVFVAPDSPIPSAYFNHGKDFVNLFYPLSILPMYLSALSNSKSMFMGVYPYAPGKSFLAIKGALATPEKPAQEEENNAS